MEPEDIIREMQKANLIGLALSYIRGHSDEMQKAIKGEYAEEQMAWSRSYGEFYVNDLNFEDVESVGELLYNTAIAIQRAKIAYLKMLVDTYGYSKGQLSDFYTELNEFDFVTIPLSNGKSSRIDDLLKIVRNAMIHGSKEGMDKFRELTGYVSVDEFLSIPVHMTIAENERWFGYTEAPTSLDREEYHISTTMGDFIIREMTAFINMYADSIRTGCSPEQYVSEKRWVLIRLYEPYVEQNRDIEGRPCHGESALTELFGRQDMVSTILIFEDAPVMRDQVPQEYLENVDVLIRYGLLKEESHVNLLALTHKGKLVVTQLKAIEKLMESS